MASFKAIFPVLQELFAKNHRGGPLPPPPSGARVKEGIFFSGPLDKILDVPLFAVLCVIRGGWAIVMRGGW